MKIYRRDGTEIGEYASVADAVASGANLSWANLSEANLRGADLREADLRWADLSGADLSGADLREADLRWADLSGADLSGARWNNAAVASAVGAPWHFGLSRHAAIVHDGKISIGCMTETVEWWREHYAAVGRKEGYTDAETAEYGAWIEFVAARLAALPKGGPQ
jgi:hypothetical protein